MDSNSIEKSFSQQPFFPQEYPLYLRSPGGEYIDFHEPLVFMGLEKGKGLW